jgi:hypothetical protein
MHLRPTNEKRAERAEQALRTFEKAARPQELDDDPASVLTDLIADLHHWSDSVAVDWENAIELARRHHAAETLGHEAL